MRIDITEKAKEYIQKHGMKDIRAEIMSCSS